MDKKIFLSLGSASVCFIAMFILAWTILPADKFVIVIATFLIAVVGLLITIPAYLAFSKRQKYIRRHQRANNRIKY